MHIKKIIMGILIFSLVALNCSFIEVNAVSLQSTLSTVGRIDEPSENQVIKGNDLVIRGWALAGSGIKEIKVYVDDKLKVITNTGLDRPDIATAYPQYQNAGKSGFKVTVNINDISSGSKSIVAEVIGNDGSSYNLYRKIIVERLPSIGRIDSPNENQEIKSNTINIEGWGVASTGVKEIRVYVDDKLKATTKTGVSRPDIATAYPQYINAANSGFKTTINVSDIANGKRKIVAEVISNDNNIYKLERTINLNKEELLPVGRIDNPSEGMTITDKEITIYGWAATGSGVKEVNLYANGKSIGIATIGLSRPDVVKAYPNYPNAGNSGFELKISSNILTQGTVNLAAEIISNDGTKATLSRKFIIEKLEDNLTIGNIDEPTLNEDIYKKNLKIKGWAINPNGIKEVRVYVNDIDKGIIPYGSNREDIGSEYPNYPSGNSCGFEGIIDISDVEIGTMVIMLEVISNTNTSKKFYTTVNLKSKANKLVVLDPGHNDGGDIGSSVILDGNAIYEKDINIQIATILKNELEKRGINVLMTRQENEVQFENLKASLERRVKLANDSGADLFVSIHNNDMQGNTRVIGTEVYYSDANPDNIGVLMMDSREVSLTRSFERMENEKVIKSKVFAQKMVDGVSQALETSNRGIKNEDFYILKNTLIPSVQVECGFMSNEIELRKLISFAYQQKIAESLANAIEIGFE